MAALSLPYNLRTFQTDLNPYPFLNRKESFLAAGFAKAKELHFEDPSDSLLKSSFLKKYGLKREEHSHLYGQKRVFSCNPSITASSAKSEPIPLLTPYKMGPFELENRIVLAPLTRNRALNNVPQPAAVTYYSQRASKGGLLITEATCISPEAHGYPHTPGIYTEEQIEAWKPIVKGVKEKGGVIFCQLWHTGRASHPDFQPQGELPVSSSPVPVGDGSLVYTPFGPKNYPIPRELKTDEIPEIVKKFRIAAKNALIAGFDGVEIHGANGYLIDQFLKDGINHRTDIYGGSIENRSRFALDVLQSVIEEIGSEKTGFRISPFGGFLDAKDSDLYASNVYLLEQFDKLKPCYVHVVEPRDDGEHTVDSIEPFRKAFKGTLITAGGYQRENGNDAIKSNHADLIAFGRLFISNPDLPRRFELNAPLNDYDRDTFYTHDQVKGYTDYPFLEEAAVLPS